MPTPATASSPASMLYPVALFDAAPGVGTLVPGVKTRTGEQVMARGRTINEALAATRVQLEAALIAYIDAGEALPYAATFEDIQRFTAETSERLVLWATVEVLPDALDTTYARLSISMPARVLKSIDHAAELAGKTRSGFLAEGALLLAQKLDLARRGLSEDREEAPAAPPPATATSAKVTPLPTKRRKAKPQA